MHLAQLARRTFAALLTASLLSAASARADNYAELGRLERGAVDTALGQRGLTIDAAPEGKRVGAIHVLNLDVFQPNDGRLLEWFNYFHRVTREGHIRRESLLLPGMPYSQTLVDETVRNLRGRSPYTAKDPALLAIVAVVPVVSPEPGAVDVLMVTRDLWSLRFNSDYNYQPGYLINLSASFSENNLFGWRKQAALAFVLTASELQLGPTYLDPNVLGTRTRLIAAFYEIWARQLGDIDVGPLEGWGGRTRVEYPLFSLSQRWAGFVDGSYVTRVARAIYGSSQRYFNPTTATCAASGEPDYAGVAQDAPCEYRFRQGGVTSGLTRSFQLRRLISRITLGHELGLVRPEIRASFSSDPQIQDAFRTAYFKVSERTSLLYFQYAAFTPRYFTYRNLDSYDLGEDLQLGPSLKLKLGRASTWLGSEDDFFLLSAEAYVNANLLGGFQSIGASWQARDYSRSVRGLEGMHDELYRGQFYAYSPVLARGVRVVTSASGGFFRNNVHYSRVKVGALEGLRGYPLDAFLGWAYYHAHLEVRTLPVSVASLRLGGLVFADAGHAAESVHHLQLYGDVGFGFRLLIPQLNSEVIRVDWAFPLRDAGIVKSGWPGRLSAGFHQAF